MSRSSPRYVSLGLVDAWRSGSVAVLAYRQLGLRPVDYPPGTFSLLWVPGYEAIPMTPIQRDSILHYIVKTRGETTRVLVEKPPRYAGAIGPLGRPIAEQPGRWLHVAGGTGVAAALSLAQVHRGTIVYGARSAEELVPLEKLGLLPEGARVVYVTEDGSRGAKGTAVEEAVRLIASSEAYDVVTAAGPEGMICSLLSRLDALSRRPRLYASPEAMIRCGLGFCGRCSLGCGLLLCRDGPFIPEERLSCWRRSRCAGYRSAAR